MERTILLVDDSAVDRGVIAMILKKNMPALRIIETSNGLDTKSLVISQFVDVCIIDLKMPQIDGFSILLDLKSDVRTVDTPVIVCSGLMSTEVLERVLNLGAYDYFSKPLSDEAMKVSLPLKVKNAIEAAHRTRNIANLSKTDPLTGLFNRHFFKTNGPEFIQSIQMTCGLLMIDINGLKVVNDAFGSETGDEFLKTAAKIISTHQPKKALTARWGGDEFVVLMADVSRKQVEDMASIIKRTFEAVMINDINLNLACGYDLFDGHIAIANPPAASSSRLIQSSIVGAGTLASPYDYFSDEGLPKEKEKPLLPQLLINAEDALIRDKVLKGESVRSVMLGSILNTLHEKNPREEAHSRRVSDACEQFGIALNLDTKEVQMLKVMGLVHDIGKIAIEESILSKPGHLSHDEWISLKRHPEIGYRLLSSAPEMMFYADAVLCHHERIDGLGYPSGITGIHIPYHAKILSIIDAFDAMTCERTYRSSMTIKAAAKELSRCSGTQFDPHLITVFVRDVLQLREEDLI